MRMVHQLKSRHPMQRKKARKRQMKNWNAYPTTSARIAIGRRQTVSIIRIFLHLACSGVGGGIAGGQQTAPAPISNYYYTL